MPPAKPRVILLTGDGKGKTTSALGMVLRAAGHGMRVALIHFIKCDRDTGENRALARFPEVEVHFCGCGFVRNPSPAHLERHRAAAQRGLELARERLQAPEPDMVVLDEICCAVSLGLLDAADVVAAVRSAPAGKIVFLTGRQAAPALVALADTVSDIACVRHGMDAGWPAQPGVEC
jgi:cob(I)alamin adenosyltransferase